MLFPIFANNPNKNPNLGFSEKFAYGLGDFASNIMWAPAAALLLYYYTEFVGVNIAIVATIMFFSRFLDGFSDLFVGWLVERTNSPYGKTRVWILRMIVPFFIAMVAMFSVPSGMGETFKYVYIFFSYNFAITVVYTAINLPYGALTTAITSDSYQRSIITIYRMIFSTTGYTLSMLVALPMVEFFGNDQFAWSITFAILGAIACLSFFITFIFCQERIVEPPAPKTSLKKTLSDIKEIFHNKYWLYLTLTMLILFSADVVFSTANTYYCRYFLNDANFVGTFIAITNVCKIGAMILFLPYCIRKIGKRNALIFASLVEIVALSIRYIDPSSVSINMAVAVVLGLAKGFTYACMFSLLPDTVDYGEYISRERHSGLVYASASFATKLASGVGAIIASGVMQFGGYVNNSVTQSPSAMEAIMYSTTLIPIIMFVAGICIISFYKLDKIFPEVINELKRRKVQNNSDLDINHIDRH